ncbi:MAG: putative sulfate/molybdate transporter [Bacteroidales bacterium]|jgi:xanthine/uracil/vitamin C permease (AzgA family)|nr:putative sulfate/molybdate transporter [Bacteroidales bacterium]
MKLLTDRIKLNRNELSGAFGDIGTDLPLIIGMLLATNLEMSNTLIVFGVLQIITSFVYGIPMPVQPLKAVALIVITQKVSASVIWGGGLAIGVIMLIITLTGLLTWLNKIIPKTVIRGIQLGLGIQLSLLAMRDYIPADKTIGYIFVLIAFIITIILIGNRKYPPAVFILLLGFVYVIFLKNVPFSEISIAIPHVYFHNLTYKDIMTGLVVLAIPQIPLSLGNSIFATNQIVKDLFPDKKISVKKIGFTYSVMNILASLFGGIPVCHGSGGIAGHYTFGGRTGGSTLIYGLFYLILGLLFSNNSPELLQIFPTPLLGVILLLEGIALIILVKDIITDKKMFFIAIVVALCANGIPNGYFIGLIVGTILYYMADRFVLKHYGRQ